MDRGTWWATVKWGHKELETRGQLNIQYTQMRKRALKYFSDQVYIYIYIICARLIQEHQISALSLNAECMLSHFSHV